MAMPEVYSESSIVAGDGASISVAWGFHGSGMTGVLLVLSDDGPVATPSGWTKIGEASAPGIVTAAFRKVAANSSEPAVTVTNPGSVVLGRIIAHRHVVTTGNPVNWVATDVEDPASSSISFALPDTTVGNCFIRAICGRPGSVTPGSMNWTAASLDTRGNGGSGTSALGDGVTYKGGLGTKVSAGACGTMSEGNGWSGGAIQANLIFALSDTATEAGPDYTLEAESGSVAVTGTDAALRVNRRLDAEAGSTAVTGVDADLLHHRRIDAEAGAVSVTGTDAGLVWDRVLSAEAGSVAATGTDADLLHHRRLAAEAGSVAVTGVDADLVYTPSSGPDHTLDAEAGSVAVTGADADLLHHRRLAAEAGAVVATGVDAALRYHRRLAAESGSAAVTGTDAALRMARRLAAELGTVVVTGTDASLEWSAAPQIPAVLTAELTTATLTAELTTTVVSVTKS